MRAMYGSVADWPALYKECYEYVDNDLPLPCVDTLEAHTRLPAT